MMRRPLLAIFVVCLVGLAGGCHHRPPGSTGAPRASSADALRVLTYNIHHGEGTDGVLDLARIAGVITGASPDLVALQEVDERALRTGGVDQVGELGRLTGMHHAFAPFMDFEGGRYGLAILSRHPIRSTRVIALPPGEREPRVALAAEVMIPGYASVTLVCLHLDWLGEDDARSAQAEALVSALEAEVSGVILAGDFNDVPGSRTIAKFEETYTNAPKPEGARSTFPAGGPRTEIDFVMYRPVFAFAGRSEVLGEAVASDHRPVLAVLEWMRSSRE